MNRIKKLISVLKQKRFLFIPFFVIFLYGCLPVKTTQVVEKIEIIQGDRQCVLPGEECKKDLILEVLGPVRKGLLGGKGEREPVKNAEIVFETLDGSDLSILPEGKIFSGPGGRVNVRVKAGTKIGDNYLKIYPITNPKCSITIRIICGVTVKGAEQQGKVGFLLPEPVKVFVCSSDKTPQKNVPVYFTLSFQPSYKSGAECRPEKVLTDENGYAETSFKTGKSTGRYSILAEVSDSSKNISIRGIKIDELAFDPFEIFIIVVGGLAIFILGMKLMSDGLQLVAGDELKKILRFFAGNRFIAVLAGTAVTGVIQSSSACSVMVVGFINAGLLTLRQAIGIIFGANIGTTVTAQMISFKLEGLAFPAIIVGVILFLSSKKSLIRGWGESILGFGMLFFGMSLMGDELKKIADFPTFINFFKMFDCTPVQGYMPFVAVIGAISIGTIMTCVIQSSSATIGIALALASSGLINFWTAFPLILGDNIGTTITAVFASLGSNRRAKQAALAHVIFNLFGTFYMVILLYVRFPGTEIPIFLYFVNNITDGDVFAAIPQNITRHIAMSHTMFNVFNVLLFIPLIGTFEKVCNFIIPVKPDEKIVHLEPHLLETPAVAIEQVIASLRYMLRESWSMISTAMESSLLEAKYEEKIEAELADREKKIDRIQEEVTDYLVQITTRTLTENQAAIVPLLMHCTNDAEKIADHAENIMAFAKRLNKVKHKFTDEAEQEIIQIWQILNDRAKHLILYLENTDKEGVNIALKNETEIDKLTVEFEKEHITRLKKGKCKVTAGIIFIEMLGELEKIGDHLTNIAERAPEIQSHHLKLNS